MKMQTVFGKRKLQIGYLMEGVDKPVTFVLSDLAQKATYDQIGEVAEALMTLIPGNFDECLITETTHAGDVPESN